VDFEEKNKNSSKSLMNSCGKFLHSPTIEKKIFFENEVMKVKFFLQELEIHA